MENNNVETDQSRSLIMTGTTFRNPHEGRGVKKTCQNHLKDNR